MIVSEPLYYNNNSFFIDSSYISDWNDSNSDFPYAADLVKFIRKHFGEYFSIGVAGYPEKHPKAPTIQEDIEYLKQKVNNGANFIITQASYSYKPYEKFAKLCRATGISIPIIPGIFIVSSQKSLEAVSNFCGIGIPQDILDIVKKNQHNPAAIRNFGVFHTTELIKKLMANDEFCGFHMFSLNDLVLLKEVLRGLGFHGTRIERPI
ncbi:hypothetical protein JTB14_020628 [Gonioctena quinquepunctata]|nr:hypothetical protein JTB14_020628 [Gonioctena quinquepunctata]